MTPSQTTTRTWPRWPTLTALTLAVLGVHMVLLADALPRWSAPAPPVATSPTPMATAVITRTLAFDAKPSNAATARASQARWIAHPVPQAEMPTPAPPPRPEPVAKTPTSAAERVPEAFRAEPDRTTVAPEESLPALVASSEAAQEPALEDPSAANNERQLAESAGQNNNASASTEEADTSLGPAQPPPSAQLTYTVEGQSKGLNFNASGSLDWRNDGENYSARMEIRMFLLGSRVQTSQGSLADNGLQPERFADKSRSERAAHFDRSQNRIRFSNNAPDAELLPGAQDRLSVFLQLAGLLNARPETYPAGQSIALPVAGTSGSQVWRFQVQGLKSLDLPAGSLIAQHLVREPQEPRDTQVDIWLAPSLGHLPVRIRLTQDNGDVVDQRLATLP